MLQNILMVQNI